MGGVRSCAPAERQQSPSSMEKREDMHRMVPTDPSSPQSRFPVRLDRFIPRKVPRYLPPHESIPATKRGGNANGTVSVTNAEAPEPNIELKHLETHGRLALGWNSRHVLEIIRN